MNSFLKIFICTFALFISTGLCAEKYSDQFGTTFHFKVRDGKAIITSFKGRTDRVRFPAYVKDKKGRKIPVTKLDLFNFYGITRDTRVLQIENGIETIEEDCFSQFKELYEVYVPQSVKFIGANAFNNGRSISYSELPEGATAAALNAGEAFFPDPVAHESVIIDPISPDTHVSGPELDPINNNTVAAGESDVDRGIPSGGVSRENTFCLIIANEKYTSKDTPDVSWAQSDGKVFYDYCRTTLGVPKENIRAAFDASYLVMKQHIEWIKMISKVVGSDAKFIVYYSGHGAPDDSGKCYLIPRDGSINNPSTGFALSDVYAALGELSAQSALVLVDACFSGCDRLGEAIPDPNGKHGIARVQEQRVTGNVVAMTAATNSQTAFAYNEKAHGLFTYFLLKALKENRGNLTYGELFDYIKKNVERNAVLFMSKEQSPTVNSGNMISTWRDIQL